MSFTLPVIAFASLFGFRFVESTGAAMIRLILTAVATAAGVAAISGGWRAKLVAPLVGKTATRTLIMVDVMIVAGAAFGASDVLRGDAPYITGWIIDLAAIGWVGVVAMSTIRHLQHRSRRSAE